MVLRHVSQDAILHQENVFDDLNRIKCWLLDMDGTITLGEKMIPGAEYFFNVLDSRPDNRYIFVTNNSSHSAEHYLRRLQNIGIKANRKELVISTDALIQNIIAQYGTNVRAFVIGTPDFERELTQAGFELIKDKEMAPQVVLVGFDTTLTYRKLDVACEYIREGIPYYAANPDKVCPLKDGKVLPDCGAIMDFLEACTSKRPIRNFGKPDRAMIEMIRSKYGYRSEEMAMVGDRIYTDVAFAKEAGITGIAVLTGETTLEEIETSSVKPDFIFDHIADIAEVLGGESG